MLKTKRSFTFANIAVYASVKSWLDLQKYYLQLPWFYLLIIDTHSTKINHYTSMNTVPLEYNDYLTHILLELVV